MIYYLAIYKDGEYWLNKETNRFMPADECLIKLSVVKIDPTKLKNAEIDEENYLLRYNPCTT